MRSVFRGYFAYSPDEFGDIWKPDRAMIFQFRRFDDAEQELMGLFHKHPDLEVVLLTASDGRYTSIEGIITQWDAGRATRVSRSPTRQVSLAPNAIR